VDTRAFEPLLYLFIAPSRPSNRQAYPKYLFICRENIRLQLEFHPKTAISFLVRRHASFKTLFQI
jgi:hypothetical protein